MTMHDVTEARLVRALEMTPSDQGLRRLDERVTRAMARPLPNRRAPFFPRFVVRPVAVLGVFVLLTTAVAGGMGLLDQLFQSSGSAGWQTAWDRAERLGIQQTDAGITITLERAYVDLNQVLVGFTVDGLDAAPLSGNGQAVPLEWMADIRDPSGRTAEQWALSRTGMGRSDTNLSAEIHFWEGAVTPTAGTWVLTFTSVGYNSSGGFVPGECTVGNTDPACVTPPANAMVEGTWQFEFDLPAPAGTIVSVEAVDTVGQATLRLTELQVSPTMIRAGIGLEIDGSPVTSWAGLPVTIQHDGTQLDVNTSMPQYVGDPAVGTGQTLFSTTAGSDEVAGTWEIEIQELDYQLGSGEMIRVIGPWTLTVTVP